jgi:hypothetical protein
MERARMIDRPAARIVLVLACLYGPYAWLIPLDGHWDSYRWHWFRMWPVMPGLLVHAIPAVHRLPDRLGYLLMAAATSAAFAAIVMLSRRGRCETILVCIVVGILSGANSWVAYQLFRA